MIVRIDRKSDYFTFAAFCAGAGCSSLLGTGCPFNDSGLDPLVFTGICPFPMCIEGDVSGASFGNLSNLLCQFFIREPAEESIALPDRIL